MTTYHPYGVSLSIGQKQSLAKAFAKRESLTIRLSHDKLSGSDELMLTKTQINRLKKAKSMGRGSDLKISKSQIRKVMKYGGSLFSTLMALGSKVLPYATKAVSKAAPALATGALSALGSLGIDKIFGEGQTGGFLIPQDKIDKLIAHKNLLTKKQKEQILASIQTGDKLVIRPSKTQEGGVLGALLATIGIPMLLKALTGHGLQGRPAPLGEGLQNRPFYNSLMPYQPPPFIGTWKDKKIGYGF